MCLLSNKKIRINIFPKTVYKVGYIPINNKNRFNSLYRCYKYELNKKYKINIKDILNKRELSNIDHCYRYFIGFHSYTTLDEAIYNSIDFYKSVIVKCKIPAFSFIIKSTASHKEILSNKIIIIEVIKQN